MSRGTNAVPVVDFSAYSLEKDKPDEKFLQKLVDEVLNAFTTIGFVYLKNTGCPPEVVSFAKMLRYYMPLYVCNIVSR